MILSNISIQQALDKGWLSIKPQPTPKTPPHIGAYCPYDTSAVDIRLANEIAWFKAKSGLVIDLTEGGFRQLYAQNSDNVAITHDQPFRLKPQEMVLGKTMERVSLPIQEGRVCLAARVEGKSSYARCGLLVHFTAPTIHANFDGTITLELINLGRIPILLYPGMPICQLIVEQVEGVPFRNDSQFQGQTTAGGFAA